METMEGIDTSRLDELARLRQESEVLEARLAAMEERRGTVSEEVFRRVQDDYLGRRRRLDEEARPLREALRGQHERVRDRWRAAERERDAARADLEEVELRRDLGELAGEDFEERREEAERRLAACEEALAGVAAVRDRFAAALGDEGAEAAGGGDADGFATGSFEQAADLDDVALVGAIERPDEGPEEISWDAGSAGDEPAAAGAAAPELPDEEEGEEEEWDAAPTRIHREPEAPEAGTEGEPAGDDWHEAPTGEMPLLRADGDAEDLPLTSPPEGEWASAPGAGEIPPAPPAPEPEPWERPAAGPEGPTQLLAPPRLVAWEGERPDGTFPLVEARTTIGRAADNGVHVLEESVSRRHAVVEAGPAGFLLRDLGSENGTYVNGERISEHRLVDGDVVHVGMRKLVFHDH